MPGFLAAFFFAAFLANFRAGRFPECLITGFPIFGMFPPKPQLSRHLFRRARFH